MTRQITQRELRNDAPAIMRAVEHGEHFVLTRNGTPIADIVPHARPGKPTSFTGAELIRAAAELPPIDSEQFFADQDAVVDPDPFRGPGEPEHPA